MNEPIAVTVVRYRCPFCPRSHSAKSRAKEHAGRCWSNPAVRGCKTCRHFQPPTAEEGDYCDVGVNLDGRPPCANCGGWPPGSDCASCGGEGEEVRAGPIVSCELWEARP